ncbi:FtsX-like permease family protein [Micromonospora sp. DR5-3]|uniref:ABC transporter permease n=1 Tax=unclassified Micromonospora TaxID=2617518 RepID=UPI0011D5DAF8|nr:MULTISPECIES: FtsX-like permease family protein [unclassified Micromonospora]MCW3817817.1 FtsX-like permease family protein [Micromonospora sp. DR5-3]TYC21935.1 FtsX-like permease family protein [Micromonospora sp. MP36]
MIRFGLRLALSGGREAAVRLVIIAAAVALGVGMLLTTLAGMNAVDAQNQRYGWLNTAVAPASSDASADPMWWLLREDYYHGKSIGRVEVAALGPDAPVPPGLPRLPGPGEYYVSPALGELLRATPAAELGDRFPGHEVGTIGRAALPSPESLLIVIGRAPAELEQLGAKKVNQIMTTSPSDCSHGCYVGINGAGLTLVLSVVAAALLFPVLIFIGTATRLAANRREQRFAAMRLIGATPRQISVISAVESTVAAAAGTAVGFGLFFACRPGLAAIPFAGEPFFPADLSLTVINVLAVALGIPLGAVVASVLALRRVQISPLGVSRRVTPKPPRAWRLIPLIAGLAELGYFIGRRPATTNGQITAYLSGFVLILVGLVLAGPWLTMIGARVLAGRASRPATLIAGRRLADNPQAGFRSVSGLIVALFVTSVATGTITTYVANRGEPRTDSVAATSLAKTFWPEDGPAPAADRIPAGLAAIPGVRSVTVVHVNSGREAGVGGDGGAPVDWPGLVTCAELDRLKVFGSCPAGGQVAVVPPDLIGMRAFDLTNDTYVWGAAAGVAATDVDRQPILSVVVNTTSPSAFEQARTMLINAFPLGRFPASVGEWEANSAQQMVQFQQLANVVMLASLPIAGCSLAVSVAGGLSDRKRPFSMLRLTGVRLRTLRRVVALETVVPLLLVAAVAIGMGFLAAHLFLRAQLGYTLLAPHLSFYLMVAGGLAVSLGIIASTLPLLRRITGPETARNE